MILKQLMNGRQSSNFIVIKDNFNNSAIKLLERFIENNLNNGNKVSFLMYENTNYEFNELFALNKNYKAVNCFEDPWNWLGKEKPNKLEEIAKSIENLQSNSLNVIIIDSFAYLLLQMDIHSICSCLKAIFDSNSETKRTQIITVLHVPWMPEDRMETKQITCLASSVISLYYNRQTLMTMVNAEHRKPSGKIIFEEYSCGLDRHCKFDFDIYKNQPKNTVSEINPMDLTTFKLALEDHEKETRSRVVLPYVKTEEKPSKVFYVPDANDDWDEEDPDDDLEI